MANNTNDFGFSAIDDSDVVKPIVVAHSNLMDQVFTLINPLLDALQKDPEKAVLSWPGRALKIKGLQEQFKKLLGKP